MNPLKFLPVAQSLASLSKDPSTKVGCLVIDDDGNILSTGFNGFPRGVMDLPERYERREVKCGLICHAESNAIAQAARNGVKLYGSTLLVTKLYPCSQCARLIVQAGIFRVFAPPIDKTNERWIDEWRVSLVIFEEGSVEVISYDE